AIAGEVRDDTRLDPDVAKAHDHAPVRVAQGQLFRFAQVARPNGADRALLVPVAAQPVMRHPVARLDLRLLVARDGDIGSAAPCGFFGRGRRYRRGGRRWRRAVSGMAAMTSANASTRNQGRVSARRTGLGMEAPLLRRVLS